MRFIINAPSLKNRRRNLRKRQTDAEYKLWQHLRNKQINGFKFYRQYSVGSYILDFYCPSKKLAIELDGSQHLTDEEYDKRRTNYLNANGIEVTRFWDNEVLQETETVLEVIWKKIITPPAPSYLKRGGS